MENKGKKVNCPNCNRIIYLEGPGKCLYCTREITESLYRNLKEVNEEFKHIDTDDIVYETEPVEVDVSIPYYKILFKQTWFKIITVLILAGIIYKTVTYFFIKEEINTEEVIVKEGIQDSGEIGIKNEGSFDYAALKKMMFDHARHYGNFPPKLSSDLNELSDFGDIKGLLEYTKDNKIDNYTLIRNGQRESYIVELTLKSGNKITITDMFWKKSDRLNVPAKKVETRKEFQEKAEQERKEEIKYKGRLSDLPKLQVQPSLRSVERK